MAKSFEEMPVWKKSRELVKFVYGITKSKEFCKDFSLTDPDSACGGFGHVEPCGRI